jgi:hypothetical protein
VSFDVGNFCSSAPTSDREGLASAEPSNSRSALRLIMITGDLVSGPAGCARALVMTVIGNYAPRSIIAARWCAVHLVTTGHCG